MSAAPDGSAARSHAHRAAADGDHSHDRGGNHAHDHGLSPEADRRYVGIALALLSVFLVVEVVAGALSGSLALLAGGGHSLTDFAALAPSLWALHLASRPGTETPTLGLGRSGGRSAAGNA